MHIRIEILARHPSLEITGVRSVHVLDGLEVYVAYAVLRNDDDPPLELWVLARDVEAEEWLWDRPLHTQYGGVAVSNDDIAAVTEHEIVILDRSTGTMLEVLARCPAGNRFCLVASDLVVEEARTSEPTTPARTFRILADQPGLVEIAAAGIPFATAGSHIGWNDEAAGSFSLVGADSAPTIDFENGTGRAMSLFGNDIVVSYFDVDHGVVVALADTAEATLRWQVQPDTEYAGGWPAATHGAISVHGTRLLLVLSTGAVCELDLVGGAKIWQSNPLGGELPLTVGFIDGIAVCLGSPTTIYSFSADGSVATVESADHSALFMGGTIDGVASMALRHLDGGTQFSAAKLSRIVR